MLVINYKWVIGSSMLLFLGVFLYTLYPFVQIPSILVILVGAVGLAIGIVKEDEYP